MSSKLLIYLIQVIDIPEITKNLDEELTGEITFDMSEEMKNLELIVKESLESFIPSIINGVSVNENPESMEIEDILDSRRIGSSRKIFYLAKMVDGFYY